MALQHCQPDPRTCQKEAIACVVGRYKTEAETNISMCTGAGKSRVIQHVSRLDGLAHVVLIFPSLLLLQQYYADCSMAYSSVAHLYYLATEGKLENTKERERGKARITKDVLREVYRVLKAGGRAVICESFQRWQGEAGQNTLLAALKEIGFTIGDTDGAAASDAVADVFQYIVALKM